MLILKALNTRIVQRIMLVLNLSIIIGICALLVLCVKSISQQGLASDFLLRANRVPQAPQDTIFICFILLLFYLLNLLIRESSVKIQRNKVFFMLSCTVDLILCVSIIIVTNVVYRGILLLSGACMLYRLDGKRQRFFVSALLIILYIVCEYQILAQIFTITPLELYTSYLPAAAQTHFSIVQHILFSCNDVLFVVFMISWIQQQKEETKIINRLYNQQYHINEELKLANIQLEHYAEKSEENALIRERNRLAREIHDTVGHSLTAISAGIDACQVLAGSESQRLKGQLKTLSALSRNALVDIRRSVRELRPDSLARMTFTEAVCDIASNISDVTDTTVAVHLSGSRPMQERLQDTLFRVIQEAITNSVKHGQAMRVDVTLEFGEAGVNLLISDNGKGCALVIEGSGLSGIRERISDFGGSCCFRGEYGFFVEIYVPYMEENND